MDAWDVEAADRAVAALVRSAGADEMFELLVRYGARDFRDIGHKAIYVANGTRTLNTIGWRHAEPVLRSVAFALLAHEAGNPAKNDFGPDRPWRENIKKAAAIRAGWQRGKITPEASADLLAAERTASPGAGGRQGGRVAQQRSRSGVGLGRPIPGGGRVADASAGHHRALHSVTTTNALHYGFITSGNDETRRMLMLQAAAFIVMFGERVKGGANVRIDALEKADLKSKGSAAVAEVFAEVSKNKATAARQALAFLDGAGADGANALLAAGRRLVFNKGRDAHDYEIQFGRDGGLLPRHAALAQPLPGKQSVLAARFRRQGQRPDRPARGRWRKGDAGRRRWAERCRWQRSVCDMTESRVSKDTARRAAGLVPAGINPAARLDCAVRMAALSICPVPAA